VKHPSAQRVPYVFNPLHQAGKIEKNLERGKAVNGKSGKWNT
jgi:hypothetical protein